MSETRSHFVKRVARGFVMVLLLGGAAPSAESAVGDVLPPVAIPADALCGGTTGGTAVAGVTGGKIGKPQFPLLIVTSCGSKLFFLDPSTNPATRVHELTTTVAPTSGWAGAVLRPDHGDLLLCTQVSTSPRFQTDLYAVDINPLNATADGTATFLRGGPTGSTCGIAWEVSTDGLADGTVYQTPSSGSSIFHYPPTGRTTLNSVPGGCPSSVTAVSVAGASLFVACPPSSGGGKPTIRQLDKSVTPGALVRSFDGPSSLTSPVGLPDDPTTLSSKFKELLWAKDKSTPQLAAIEIPGGTLGQKIGPPALFPAACPADYPTAQDGSPLDTDDDGHLDCWEDDRLWTDGLPGPSFIGNWTGIPADRDLTMCIDANLNGNFGLPGSAERATECSKRDRKDIYVELDYMHYHDPRIYAADALCDPTVSSTCDATTSVIVAFANAPVSNPDGSTGIRLHVLVDEEMPHTDRTALVPCTPAPAAGDETFDHLKFGVNTGTTVKGYFGTFVERAKPNTINAKYFVYHYGEIVHSSAGSGNTSTGCAEVGGNDFMTSLGSAGVYNFGTAATPDWHGVGNVHTFAGTWLHEFGHNLGLQHGGFEYTNCKPNYVSVMNYTRQVPGPISPRIPLDYSRQKLPTLNEAGLSESDGLGAPVDSGPAFSGQIAFGPLVCDDQLCDTQSSSVVDVSSTSPVDWSQNGVEDAGPVGRDINNFSIAGCPASPGQMLEGYNDWANIKLNFRRSLDWGDGARVGIADSQAAGDLELTFDEMLKLTRDRIDFKPSDPNNTIVIKATQTAPVALLSRGGDGALDAADLNPATVVLRGTDGFTWVVPVKKTAQGVYLCNLIDVDGDGMLDNVCQFDMVKNSVDAAETRVVFEGMTFSGQSILASDVISVK